MAVSETSYVFVDSYVFGIARKCGSTYSMQTLSRKHNILLHKTTFHVSKFILKDEILEKFSVIMHKTSFAVSHDVTFP